MRCATHLELDAGDAAAAERDFRRCYDEFGEMGDRGYRASAAAGLAAALAAQARFEEALEFSRISEDLGGGDDIINELWRRLAGASALAGLERLNEAERVAREAMALAERTDSPTFHCWALLRLGEVLSRQGRAGEAAGVVAEALRLYERKGDLVGAGRARSLLSGGVGAQP